MTQPPNPSPQRSLGACNPRLAHRALVTEVCARLERARAALLAPPAAANA